MNTIKYLCPALIILGISTQSLAYQSILNDGTLAESCKALPDKETTTDQGRTCLFYIEGFLAGSTYISEEYKPAVDEPMSEFFKRAHRTRIGSRSQSDDAGTTLSYCLPEGGSYSQVVDTIAESVSQAELTADQLGSHISSVLNRNYPCS